MLDTDIITMAHGSGGLATNTLIDQIFAKNFDSDVLNEMEDSAVVSGNAKIAMTTDSFVVTPVEFKGGDIGRLCICGTVNDLLMRGATPKYITCGFIIQEGASIEVLKRVVESMAKTAKEAGVKIVAGDTKVVNGNGEFYINTAGVGFVDSDVNISSKMCKKDDVIIVSGNMGDHHAAILSDRMGIENDIKSDCAPLGDMVWNLINNNVEVHALRDVTRGGLATVLKELAKASNLEFDIEKDKIPVTATVKNLCGLLGLDPLYMGNEGKLVAIVSKEDAQKALDIIKSSKYGKDAAIIGKVTDKTPGDLVMETEIGSKIRLNILTGEGLPRIC